MDGVIELDPKRKRRLPVALAVATLSWLVATSVIDTAAPAPEVRLIGVERTRMLELEKQRSFVDGTLAASIERRLRLRSRVRQTLAPRWVAALLLHAGVGSEDVIVGLDRWLFLRSRAKVDDAVATRAPGMTARTLAAIRRRFAARGSELCVMPIPRKAVACSDQLPTGFDSAPDVDAAIVRAIVSSGVPSIDVGATWADLPSRERFLQFDTHWATPAQAALASRIADRYPSYRAAPGDEVAAAVTAERSIEPQDAGLLWYLGLDPMSAAAAPLGIPDIERVRLASAAPAGARATQSGPANIALVGSSFTATFDLHALLSESLGRDVQKFAVAGAAFSDPLVRLVASSHAAGQPLPTLVLFEFPMNQALALPGFQRGPGLALAQLFQRLEPVASTPLDEVRTTCRWKAGEALSSGDGVLQVALEISGDLPSRWELRSSGMRLAWKLDAGEHRLVLPVVDGHDGPGGVRLVPLDEGARAARTRGALALDADATKARGLRESGRTPVAPLDVLVVRWEAPGGTAERLCVTIEGASRGGTPTTVTHTFEAPAVDFAALGMPRLEGGWIRSVTVDGAKLASARLVPLPGL